MPQRKGCSPGSIPRIFRQNFPDCRLQDVPFDLLTIHLDKVHLDKVHLDKVHLDKVRFSHRHFIATMLQKLDLS